MLTITHQLDLYFSDGINGEANGLFGAIAAHREEAKENDEGGKEGREKN